MKRYGRWDVSVSCEETPDNNLYEVTFADRKTGNAAARVHARVYTNFGVAGQEATVDRIDPGALEDVADAELLRIAEIEVNSVPGLPEYVFLPGSDTDSDDTER